MAADTLIGIALVSPSATLRLCSFEIYTKNGDEAMRALTFQNWDALSLFKVGYTLRAP